MEPCGYGIKFVSAFAGGSLLPIDFKAGPVNATAYAFAAPTARYSSRLSTKMKPGP